MSESFEKFKDRIESKEIRKLWDTFPGVKKNFLIFFMMTC